MSERIAEIYSLLIPLADSRLLVRAPAWPK